MKSRFLAAVFAVVLTAGTLTDIRAGKNRNCKRGDFFR